MNHLTARATTVGYLAPGFTGRKMGQSWMRFYLF